VIDWLLRNRETGRLTVAQFPNVSLVIFLAASLLRLLGAQRGDVRTIVDLVAAISILWWAVDEVIRGVNPFRRMLGTAVLAWIVARALL